MKSMGKEGNIQASRRKHMVHVRDRKQLGVEELPRVSLPWCTSQPTLVILFLFPHPSLPLLICEVSV